MNEGKTLGLILDIGSAMIRSGAETHRVEDSLYRLCDSYGFTACNIWVVPSNIQATVTTPAGECLTQIRHIRTTGVDFDRLDRLNNLSREVCRDKPEAGVLASRFDAAMNGVPQKPWMIYLAGALAGAGFGVFFNCDALDAAAAAFTSLLVTFLVRRLGRRENNPLILNFIVSMIAELFIIICVACGLGHHMGYVTVGVVMLLISALGATNGLRDLVHLDTLSGVMNITASLTGAIGIALGIALPLVLFRAWGENEITVLNPSVAMQLAACTLGCTGFALWFNVKGKKVAFCGLGALLTWAVYLISLRCGSNAFAATLFASITCGFYAQLMARFNKAPATIFMTVSVFPLIPGAALYYMMYGFVLQDLALGLGKGAELLLACFGIVLGFMVVEVASRYIWGNTTAR